MFYPRNIIMATGTHREVFTKDIQALTRLYTSAHSDIKMAVEMHRKCVYLQHTSSHFSESTVNISCTAFTETNLPKGNKKTLCGLHSLKGRAFTTIHSHKFHAPLAWGHSFPRKWCSFPLVISFLEETSFLVSCVFLLSLQGSRSVKLKPSHPSSWRQRKRQRTGF